MKIQEIAYHRNGVRGRGFFAVRFRDGGQNLLAIVFHNTEHMDDENPAMGADFAMRTAVIDIDKAKDTVAFGENSFRGDHYDSFLRSEINKWSLNEIIVNDF